jgi:cephalosporin hydroxylase
MESIEAVTSTTELIDKAFSLGMIQVREEITDMVEFLKQRPLRNVMEIGSESGGTFYLWSKLAKLGGLKISLDKPDGTSGSWLYKEPDALAKRTALFQSFAPRVRVVTGDSHSEEIKAQVAGILKDEKLDFLFIDGDHSYEGVKADWDMYREFVRPGGIVAFHDINQGEWMNIRGCQVGRLWAEIWREAIGRPVDIDRQLVLQEFNSKLHWAGIGLISV